MNVVILAGVAVGSFGIGVLVAGGYIVYKFSGVFR